ncbi:MAG: sterol desaturase family protein [Planctomycetales bacterium]|nr:sterol desaturase family protein [Planctomycetales bacterium]
MEKYEGAFRVVAFFVVLTAMGVWEAVAPRRRLTASKPWRWFSNLALLVINTAAVRLIFTLGAAGIALESEKQGWGLFNNLDAPGWLELVLAVFLLDLAIYLQHILFHAVPLLWRLHMVHHADPDFDVTTGIRFHTLEIAISMGIKAGVIIALGPSPLSVILFEILLNTSSMFSHSNIALPLRLDRVLRLFVVTPDMHRVHHSVIPAETNSNFGFNVPWWDYLFGTYRSQPQEGHTEMRIGLKQIPIHRAVSLGWLLILPFTRRNANQSESGADRQ